MKKLFIALTLLLPSFSFAEFGKVVDADGYVNVRKDKDASSPTKGALPSGSFVYVFDEDMYDKWLFSLPQNGNDAIGFIHKSRIQFINQDSKGDNSEIPMSAFNASKKKIRFSDERGKVTVTIKAEDFDYPANQHKFTRAYFTEGDNHYSYLTHYNGQEFWGTDHTEPKNMTHYKSITVNMGGRVIKVPKSDVEGLFSIGLRQTKVYADDKTDSVYISAAEGDGAGAYQVLFAIENGRYIGRKLVIPY